MGQVSFNWMSYGDAAPEGASLGGNLMEDQMDQNMMDKVRELEHRIVKVVSTVKEQREENRALQVKITALEDELRNKDDEIRHLRAQIEQAERAKQSIAALREERAAVRAQVEDILRELESIELN